MKVTDILIPVHEAVLELVKQLDLFAQACDNKHLTEAGVYWGRITQLAANIQTFDKLMRDAMWREYQDQMCKKE